MANDLNPLIIIYIPLVQFRLQNVNTLTSYTPVRLTFGAIQPPFDCDVTSNRMTVKSHPIGREWNILQGVLRLRRRPRPRTLAQQTNGTRQNAERADLNGDNLRISIGPICGSVITVGLRLGLGLGLQIVVYKLPTA